MTLRTDTASLRLSLVCITSYKCSGRKGVGWGRQHWTKWSQHARHKEGLFPVSQTELLPVASEMLRRHKRIPGGLPSAGDGTWLSVVSGGGSLFFFCSFYFFLSSFFFFNIYFSLLRYQRRGKHTESKRPAQSPNTVVQLNPKAYYSRKVCNNISVLSLGS